MNNRTVVFISHANPEDNAFARWVTLKLAALGYKAWSDVTRLFGGEDFWRDIERVIRNDTVKFLYVLSRESNIKEGALRELRVADAVAKSTRIADFIVPLRTDDLPYGEINIELARLNAIDFSTQWAQGLKQLEKKLSADAVPRDDQFGPDLVRQWWNAEFSADAEVSDVPEVHFSNWFPLDLPRNIFRYSLMGLASSEPAWAFPVRWHEMRPVTFGTREEVQAGLGSLRIQDVEVIETAQFLSGANASRGEHRNIVSQLLTEAWETAASVRGLKPYDMSGGRQAFYFDLEALPEPDVAFISVSGARTHRALMGYRTMSTGKRHWHFAVSAQPAFHPQPLISLRTHVVFSDDGRKLWSSSEAMHQARRTNCKDWWNDDWRDRLLATMTWLAHGHETIRLALSPSVFATLRTRPIEFLSPVTLKEPLPASRTAAMGGEVDNGEGEEDDDDGLNRRRVADGDTE